MGTQMEVNPLAEILAKNPGLFWNLLREHPELVRVYKKVGVRVF
jgi:hypothetical protein